MEKMLTAVAKGRKQAAPPLCSWGWGRSDGASRTQPPSCLSFPASEDQNTWAQQIRGWVCTVHLLQGGNRGWRCRGRWGPCFGEGLGSPGGNKSVKTRRRGVGREDEEREERGGGGGGETDCADHLLRVLLIAWAQFSSAASALLQELPAMGAGTWHQPGPQQTLRDGAG